MEQYLRECLDSLVHQTLQDIEIIVVNDCSPDNSETIILEYAARDPRIVYIKHEENKCLGGARNTGIRAARGKYITFVDSDDYVDATLYQAVIKAFETHEVNVVCIPFRSFPAKKVYFKEHIGVYRAHVSCLLKLCYVNVWSKVYRLADLRKYDLLFPEHMFREDVPFWLELCACLLYTSPSPRDTR